jgi:uncharacterized repeat protein (TIGR03806 family)
MRRAALLPGLAIAALLAACGGSSSSGPAVPAPSGPVFGLDQRPGNLSCLAPPLAAPEVDVALEPVFANLPFTQPLGLLQAPGDDSRWFVVERGGRVGVFVNTANVTAFDPDFIQVNVNASNLESGLLGMAFHPDFAVNGEVFLSFVEGPAPGVSVVARYRSVNGGLTLDPGTREDILRVEQDGLSHNAGHILFGPDGNLYVSLGDGMYAEPADPNERAQDTTSLLGSLLRLDVDGGSPYAIPGGPDGNPFAGNATCPADHSSTTDCPEIYAFGFRNPWRFSFDRAGNALWLGDVGQHAWEEVDLVERGGNYGWNCREGKSEYASAGPSCTAIAGLADPVHDYPRPDGNSVTGGFVYRGSAIPELVGQYVFGDFISGRIWRLVEDGAGGYRSEELASPGILISTFAEDTGGELLAVHYGGFGPGANGAIYRIVPGSGAGGTAPSPVAELLSATGCVDPGNPALPAAGLIPYDVNASAWFDGAARERWLAIPDGTTIAVDVDDGRFELPERSVLMEHLRVAGALVETRLTMHHPGGEWRGYSYAWNAPGSEAELVRGGRLVDLGSQQWLHPSANGCAGCHRPGVAHAPGLELAQLNRELRYPATGRTSNQLATLAAIGLFTSPIGAPDTLPALPDPADTTLALGTRARAWLHANCSHCHGGGGVALAGLDLRLPTSLDETGTCDVAPQRGSLGIANASIIAPGDPDRSVLVARITRRGFQSMPPYGSLIVDAAGTALVGDWIGTLVGCQ